MRATVTVSVTRDSGAVITYSVQAEQTTYPRRETQAQFKARLRARIATALATVLD